MQNLISDPISSGSYYSEYLQTIKYYQDQKRTGVFIRYYNINASASANRSQTSSNLVRSNYTYDIYEYTPTLAIDETSDTVQDDPEKSGLMFQGEMGITTYTIKYPRIHDIISFTYAPNTTDHIYRVKGISSILNIQDAGVHISKLELEYAFNKNDLGKLDILDEYVYSVYDKSNVLKLAYLEIMNEQNIIMSALSNLVYDEYFELYYYIDSNNEKIAPLNDNLSIADSLTSNNNKRQYYIDTKPPFGAYNYTGIASTSYYNITTRSRSSGVLPVSLVTAVASYVPSTSDLIVSDCAKLLNLFQG